MKRKFFPHYRPPLPYLVLVTRFSGPKVKFFLNPFLAKLGHFKAILKDHTSFHQQGGEGGSDVRGKFHQKYEDNK